MKWVRAGSLRRQALARLGLAALLVATGLLYFVGSSHAAVPVRSILMNTDQVSATARYVLSFDLSASETLGSIKVEFCSNDPIIGNPCTPPGGFDVSGAVLSAQSGETGFSVYGPGTNANTLVLTRVASVTIAPSLSYTLDGITNPSSNGSFYARLQTFASTDASGPENEHGGLAMALNNAVQISTEVPPFLLFCSGVTISAFDCNTAAGNYINFGNVASSSTASATSQLLTATNAANGFAVTISGSTMTSGNNLIAAIASQDVSRPGTQQFGLNLVANTTPLVGANVQGPGAATPATGYDLSDFYKFGSGDTIATATGVDDFRKLTVSYILNIPLGQPIGVYTTTLTYVCLANF